MARRDGRSARFVVLLVAAVVPGQLSGSLVPEQGEAGEVDVALASRGDTSAELGLQQGRGVVSEPAAPASPTSSAKAPLPSQRRDLPADDRADAAPTPRRARVQHTRGPPQQLEPRSSLEEEAEREMDGNAHASDASMQRHPLMRRHPIDARGAAAGAAAGPGARGGPASLSQEAIAEKSGKPVIQEKGTFEGGVHLPQPDPFKEEDDEAVDDIVDGYQSESSEQPDCGQHETPDDAAKSTVQSYWLEYGCRSTMQPVLDQAFAMPDQARYALSHQKVGKVQCCSAWGKKECVRKGAGVCFTGDNDTELFVTYGQALTTCESVNMRLCTRDELLAKGGPYDCCQAGCSLNDQLVWTSTTELESIQAKHKELVEQLIRLRVRTRELQYSMNVTKQVVGKVEEHLGETHSSTSPESSGPGGDAKMSNSDTSGVIGQELPPLPGRWDWHSITESDMETLRAENRRLEAEHRMLEAKNRELKNNIIDEIASAVVNNDTKPDPSTLPNEVFWPTVAPTEMHATGNNTNESNVTNESNTTGHAQDAADEGQQMRSDHRGQAPRIAARSSRLSAISPEINDTALSPVFVLDSNLNGTNDTNGTNLTDVLAREHLSRPVVLRMPNGQQIITDRPRDDFIRFSRVEEHPAWGRETEDHFEELDAPVQFASEKVVEKEIFLAFEAIDSDKDGKISWQDLDAVFWEMQKAHTLPDTFDAPRMHAGFLHCGVDGQQKLDEAGFSRFVKGTTKVLGQGRHEFLLAFFEATDPGLVRLETLKPCDNCTYAERHPCDNCPAEGLPTEHTESRFWHQVNKRQLHPCDNCAATVAANTTTAV